MLSTATNVINFVLWATQKFFWGAVENKKRAEKGRTETLWATQLNSGNEVRHQIQCKWYHYTGWTDGLLQLPCSCCGIRLTVLRAALLLGWPLPATGAPATPWVPGGLQPPDLVPVGPTVLQRSELCCHVGWQDLYSNSKPQRQVGTTTQSIPSCQLQITEFLYFCQLICKKTANNDKVTKGHCISGQGAALEPVDS